MSSEPELPAGNTQTVSDTPDTPVVSKTPSVASPDMTSHSIVAAEPEHGLTSPSTSTDALDGTISPVHATSYPPPSGPPQSFTPSVPIRSTEDDQVAVNPRLASLRAIFPDFDPSVLESVLDSVNGDEERAADVLLSMNDPNYVSQVQHQPTQTELDEELARRLMLEESNAAQQDRDASWYPERAGRNVPYRARQNPPRQNQGQGDGNTMAELQENFSKFAESGKKTLSNLFSKAKAKVAEFDSNRSSGGPSQPPQGQWAGQNQSYFSAPQPETEATEHFTQPPSFPSPNSSGPALITTQPPPAPYDAGRTHTQASPVRSLTGSITAPPTTTSSTPSNIDPSRIGLLPKRPVSLLGNKSPPRREEEEEELDYVENPFEEGDRHR